MSTYQIDAPAGAIYADSGLIASGRAIGLNAGHRAWQLVQPVLRLFVRALAEYRTRRAVREMQQLDDRMLRDIGVTRESVDYAVRYGREREVSLFAREWASWGVADPFRR
jgi:uncharacterized protein YjiS (DUF1127 family)